MLELDFCNFRHFVKKIKPFANVAQVVEQFTRNDQVSGSNPLIGSIPSNSKLSLFTALSMFGILPLVILFLNNSIRNIFFFHNLK